MTDDDLKLTSEVYALVVKLRQPLPDYLGVKARARAEGTMQEAADYLLRLVANHPTTHS